ncbi:PH domain-containing protein (plasmid) [Chryseobacterium sp. JJR-5R]|uniref:PH domain-containing protein n=1 Tax=Chryseobacterium sp. JJR-5R TaxID=3093923 RepID=UPI002A763F4F|nr:PH domain-containing protein [Chryseobacterium sp. JJR-5R]WPO84630.1 PH domain-containing protein [Chryseobacterium sp. JJR-5R]
METDNPVLYQTKSNWISYVYPVSCIAIGFIGIPGFFILSGLLKLICFLLIILFYKGVSSLLRKKSVKLYITEGTLSISSGVFYKMVHDIPINKIEGVGLFQNWIGRIFNYGTLTISIGNNVLMYSISGPEALRSELIKQMQNKL